MILGAWLTCPLLDVARQARETRWAERYEAWQHDLQKQLTEVGRSVWEGERARLEEQVAALNTQLASERAKVSQVTQVPPTHPPNPDPDPRSRVEWVDQAWTHMHGCFQPDCAPNRVLVVQDMLGRQTVLDKALKEVEDQRAAVGGIAAPCACTRRGRGWG